MKTVKKILLYGYGNAGARHYDNFTALHHEVIVVDQKNYDWPLSVAVNQYYNINDLQHDHNIVEFDAFIIATPPSAREMVLGLIETGKPLLCEKPLTYPGCMPTPAWWVEHKNKDNIWTNLQMSFMPTYQAFFRQMQDRTIASVTVTAWSDASKWVGVRGQHQQPIIAPYEYAHDINLAYRLMGQKTHEIELHCSLRLDWPYQEIRRIAIIAEDGEYVYEIDRQENVMAYRRMAEAFCKFIETGERSPWSTSVDDWIHLTAILDEE